MKMKTGHISRVWSLIAIGCVVLALACAQEVSAPGADRDGRSPVFARATSTSDMSVTSASPDSATQDTTLDVTISGSGFVQGTTAKWSLAGVSDSTQVRTNSTRYVNQKQLIANITISASATIAKWDVVVTASGKKGGIGTEAFAIKAHHVSTDTKPNVVWDENVNIAPSGQPAVWTPALITGDYRNRNGTPVTDGTSGEYQDAYCGSSGYMQSTQMTYPQAALNFDPDAYSDSATVSACGGKRYYKFFFSGRSSAPVLAGPQHYALHLSDLAVGQSLIEEVHFGVQLTNCSALRFDDLYPPANNAIVTRLADTTLTTGPARRWRVQSQGSHRAMCTLFTNKGPKPTGVTYYLPFSFVVVEMSQPFASFP